MTKKRAKKRDKQNDGLEFGNVDLSLEPEITPYLVPVGIPGLYKSPTEPVDPYNCEQWPQSPYCGGNPLNRNFVDINVDISINPCEQCITFSPVLGGISLPPYTICRRSNSPECELPPVPFPDIPSENEAPNSLANPRRVCAEGTYIITTEYVNLNYVTRDLGRSFPGEVLEGTELGDALKKIESQRNIYSEAAALDAVIIFGATVGDISSDSGFYEYYQANPFVRCYVYLLANDGTKQLIKTVISPGFQNRNRDLERRCPYPGGELIIQYSITELWLDYDYIYSQVFPTCQGAPNIGPISPPYRQPDNEDNCCMACSGDSEELLRKIAKRLGTDDYPVKVPQSLLADRGNGSEQIESVTQFIGWFVKQFDAVIGQFPIEIEIADNDPTKEGNQKEKVVIPNLAEGIAELMGVGLGTNINTNTLINTAIRILIESGSSKIHALESKYLAQAIADYLAFDTEETKTPVPMMFTAGKTNLDEILQEKDQEVMLHNYSDDRDFKAEMTELLHSAAIIRAVHFKKVGTTGDTKGELLNRFKELLRQAQEKDKPENTSIETDFSDFMEQVEGGFTNVSGIDDVLNPYGRNFSQRPKIRELGNTSDGTSENI